MNYEDLQYRVMELTDKIEAMADWEDTLTEELNKARSMVRVLLHAYENDNSPPDWINLEKEKWPLEQWKKEKGLK